MSTAAFRRTTTTAAATPSAPLPLGRNKDELSVLHLEKGDALTDQVSRAGIAAKLLPCKPVGRWCLRRGGYDNTPHINVVVYLPVDENGRRTVDMNFRPWAVKCVPGHLVFGARHLTHLDRRGLPVINHEKTLYDAWKFEQQKQRAQSSSSGSPKRQRVVAAS